MYQLDHPDIIFRSPSGIVVSALLDTGCKSNLFVSDLLKHVSSKAAGEVELKTAHGPSTIINAFSSKPFLCFAHNHSTTNATIIKQDIKFMDGINKSMFAVGRMIRKEGFHMETSAYTGKTVLYNKLFDGSHSNIIQIQPNANCTQWDAIFSMNDTSSGAKSIMDEFLRSPKSISACCAVLPSINMAHCDEFIHETRRLGSYLSQIDSPFLALAGAVQSIFQNEGESLSLSPLELLQAAEHQQFMLDTDSDIQGARAGLSAKNREKNSSRIT